MSTDHNPISDFRLHCGSLLRPDGSPSCSSDWQSSTRVISHRSVLSGHAARPANRTGGGQVRAIGARAGGVATTPAWLTGHRRTGPVLGPLEVTDRTPK